MYTLKESGVKNITFYFDKIDNIHDYLVEKFKSALKKDIALIDEMKQPTTILEILKHYHNIFETLQIEVLRYYVDRENGIVLTNYNKSVTIEIENNAKRNNKSFGQNSVCRMSEWKRNKLQSD